MEKASETYDAVLWSGKETRKLIVNTAIASSQFTRNLGIIAAGIFGSGIIYIFVFFSVQDLEMKLSTKLDGLSREMQASFNSLESNLMMHTTMVMDQMHSFQQSITGKLNIIICNQQRFDIYPNLRLLQNILDSYSNGNVAQKEMWLNETVQEYRTKFEVLLLPELHWNKKQFPMG